ncbi:MAG: hypothetical protein JRI23_00065 [Deltaproteobacteria bacterium]|jgi:hypothetical protein|nr:hypothetical protein [Deltaproteobacteria bacterium]MBW2529837.1 hypothetical protein [Deltaproteobacteria bacterium]
MSAPEGTDAETSYEVRSEGHVVGPVTWDRIRRGRAANRIPAGAQARSVGPWRPVDELLQDAEVAPSGAAPRRNAPHEVRVDQQIVGPVTRDQIHRGRSLGKIPDGAQARVVGPWRKIDPYLAETSPRLRVWDPPPSRPGPPMPSPVIDDTQELPPTESTDTQRWHLRLNKEDPALLVDTNQLVEGLRSSAVQLSAEVRPVESDRWSPVWDVPELADAIRELPPASVRGLLPRDAAQRWFLEMPGVDRNHPMKTEWIVDAILAGKVPLSARVRAALGDRPLPVWDVPEFAEAIQQTSAETWRAREQGDKLFEQAETAREPTAAIELYASAAERFRLAENTEAAGRVGERIRARARGQISTLLAEGQPGKAREFLAAIRHHALAVGLDQCLDELEWRIWIALSDH